MTRDELIVTRRNVGEALVASIRFVGRYSDIGERFRQLYDVVKVQVSGRTFTLYHGGDAEHGYDIEVCVPVSGPVDTGDIKSRTLEGGEMLCTIHRGPYGPPEAETSLAKSWGRFWRYVGERGIGVSMDPCREVYLEDDTEHGGDAERYVTELQIPLLLPRWLDRLADGLARWAGEETRRSVMEGSDRLSVDSSPEEKSEWVEGAMARLDAAVDDETSRRSIMAGCAHRFPDERVRVLREAYERLGSVDGLIEFMRTSPSWGGAPYYRDPNDEENVIYIEKPPFDPKGREEATDDAEKRALYCHCSLVRAAIRSSDRVSPTFCGCGAGWYVRIWEGILGRPVRVEVIKTVLEGDDCCRFGIHLPRDA